MKLTIGEHPIPLRIEPDGTARVGETRVTLDVLVNAYKLGDTAEEIAAHFPALELADVYTVLGYYLRNTCEVDAYLDTRQREADEFRAKMEARSPSSGLRERLLARRAQQHAQP